MSDDAGPGGVPEKWTLIVGSVIGGAISGVVFSPYISPYGSAIGLFGGSVVTFFVLAFLLDRA